MKEAAPSLSLSRRSALAGLFGLVACGTAGAGNTLHDPSSASELWAAKIFGRAPSARLVKRATGNVPGHEEPPFLRNWQIGWAINWPVGSRSATHTEIYEDRSGERVAIFRGVGQVDPRTRTWNDAGRSRSGVWELRNSPYEDRFRLFILPDGTWVAGWGAVALRLSGHFASESSSPPRLEPKPGALFVQETVVSPESRPFGSSTALYAADQIRGLTIAAYGAPPGSEVPTTLDIVYPSSSLASAAAADIARMRAASQNKDIDEAFFRRAVIVSDGSAVVMRSVLPYNTLVSWGRA